MRFGPHELKINGKIIHLIHDLVINHDMCNMHCQYCMTAGSIFNSAGLKRDNGRIQWNNRKKSERYEDDSRMKIDIDTVSDNYHVFFDAPILKVSGGEIFLIKGICNFLKKESMRYESVQILTNGTIIDRLLINELALIPNLYIQMSMDGHTFTMNRLRAGTPEVHNKLLANLDKIVRQKIPVEIFCVLTRQNTAGIKDFADYLMNRYEDRVGLTCFPVRHEIGTPFFPRHEDLYGLQQLITHFEKYRGILPPIHYLDGMLGFLRSGRRRSLRCMVPFLMIQTFNDGTVTPCPYCWVEKTGDLLKTPAETAAAFGTHPSYHMRTTDPPWAPFCRSCWTDGSVYSLFMNDSITMDELCLNRPVLKGARVQKRLNEFKSIFTAKIESE